MQNRLEKPLDIRDMAEASIPTPNSWLTTVFSDGWKLKQKDSNWIVTDFTAWNPDQNIFIYNSIQTNVYYAKRKKNIVFDDSSWIPASRRIDFMQADDQIFNVTFINNSTINVEVYDYLGVLQLLIVPWKIVCATIEDNTILAIITGSSGDLKAANNLSDLSDVNIARTNLWVPSLELLSDTKAFTWFVDNLNITVTWNSTNRTVILTHATLVEYYWRGSYVSLTNSWTSAAHGTDTSKIYYLYSTDWATFAWSETKWDYYNIQVSLAFYDTTNSKWIYTREIHWTYDYESHIIDHNNIGTFRMSGWNLTDWTYVPNTSTDVAITPWFDQALIYDEDLPSIIPAWIQWTYTTVYIWAAWVATFWTTDSFPFKYTAAWYINYNNTTAWTLVQWATLKHYNVYQILMPVASDADSQKFRTILLQPQNEYGTLVAAEGEDFRSLNLWNLVSMAAEFVVYTRLTYSTNASYATTGKVQLSSIMYLSWSKASQVLVWGFNPSSHANLNDLNWVDSWHIGTANTLAWFDVNWLASTTVVEPIPNYTITWYTPDRVLDVDNTNINELANVLATHISDVQEWLRWPVWGWLTWTKEVDETAIGDEKILIYKVSSWKLEYIPGITLDNLATLLNKRINSRIVSAASYTTDTWTSLSVATADEFIITAQAWALKFNNPLGAPLEWQKLVLRIKDNWTARALTYDTQYRASSDLPFPTTTIVNKTLYLWIKYNSTDSKWDLLAVLNNF